MLRALSAGSADTLGLLRTRAAVQANALLAHWKLLFSSPLPLRGAEGKPLEACLASLQVSRYVTTSQLESLMFRQQLELLTTLEHILQSRSLHSSAPSAAAKTSRTRQQSRAGELAPRPAAPRSGNVEIRSDPREEWTAVFDKQSGGTYWWNKSSGALIQHRRRVGFRKDRTAEGPKAELCRGSDGCR